MTPDRTNEEEYEDFSDPSLDSDETQEETQEYSDDLDADADWSDEDLQEAPPVQKKKGGLFNIVVMGVGVLLFIGFAYFKMSAAPSSVPAQGEDLVASADSVPQPVTGDEAVPPPMPEMSGADQAGPSEISAAPTSPAEGEQATLQATPSPIEATVPDFTITETPVSSVSEESSTETAQTQQPIPEGLSFQMPLAPSETGEKGNAQNPMPAVTPVPEEGGKKQELALSETDPVIKAAPATEPVAEDRIHKIENDLMVLQKKIETQQASGPKSSADPERQALSDELKNILDRLERLEKSGGPLSSGQRVKTKQDQIALPQERDPVEGRKKIPPKAESGPVYLLRAVSNGKAYLTPARGGSLVSVRTGDFLEGIGTVQAIEQQKNGHWVVIGTQARVRQ